MSRTSLVLVANAGDGTISTFRLTPDGTLARLSVSPVGSGCSTFAIDARRDFVFAGVKGEPNGIVTLALDRQSGSLAAQSRVDTEASMTYLALAPDAMRLFGASYGGGLGIVSPVARDGSVGAPTARIAYPNLHSVAVSADGRFAYFVSLGDDLVAQYAVTAFGGLAPLDPPAAAAPAGSGPRHIVCDASQTNAYVMTEFTGEVLHYRRDPASGVLVFRSATPAYAPEHGLRPSVFGADPLEHHYIWGADVHLAPGHTHVWCSERTESTLATLPIDGDGSPHPATSFAATETQPRGFAVSPDGRYLVAAGERSTHVSVYATSPDGALALLARVETGAGANWVRFVED